jgi:hypothetical protein
MLSENLLVKVVIQLLKIPNFAPAIHVLFVRSLAQAHRGNQMKVRFLTLALICSLPIINTFVCDSVLAQRPARNRQSVSGTDRWYVFVSPDGDFTLSFPQRPNQEPDQPGPKTAIRSYVLQTQNGMRFSINSQGSFAEPNPRLATNGMITMSKRCCRLTVKISDA